MAQYKKNFYSSTLYGRISAFYGDYTTQVFDAVEPFSEAIKTKIFASLPTSFYRGASEEFEIEKEGDWLVDGSDLYTKKANSPLRFFATGDDIEIDVRMQKEGEQQIKAVLYKDELVGDKYEWVEKETQSIQTYGLVEDKKVKSIKFNRHGFGDFMVELVAEKTSGKAIVVGGRLRTSEVGIQVRASKDNEVWTEWETVSVTPNHVSGDDYELDGVGTTKYSSVRYIQGKVIILASDNINAPVVHRIELRSDDSGLYIRDGRYTAKINMNLVAQSVGKTFKQSDKVVWGEDLPNGTRSEIRSSSSDRDVFWGPITAPYKKETRRLRLKDDVVSHSVTLGPFKESDKFAFSKITKFRDWETQSFYPLDETHTKTEFIFSKTKNDIKNPRNLLQTIESPMYEENKSIRFTPQPYFLTVEMNRTRTSGTPVVDWIEVYQDIEYKEEVNFTDKDMSAVDSEGSGRKVIQKINDYPFTLPSGKSHIDFNKQSIESAEQTYELTDKTNRPSDIILFLLSEEGKTLKTNITTNPSEHIVGQAYHRRLELGDESGLLTHYSYLAGKVQYLRPYERELDSSFTPYLLMDKKYKYYVQNGWPDDYHTVIPGQTLKIVADMHNTTPEELVVENPDLIYNEDETLLKGQMIKVPNNTVNEQVDLVFGNNTYYTEKSSHNALYDQNNGETVTDLSSEKILVSVPNKPELGYVDWVSEEKIYNGVINPNDVRNEFTRIQYNTPTNYGLERSHVVSADETWESIAIKYDIDEIDLVVANSDIKELKSGDEIIIPPNIVLPSISPVAEFESNRKYEIEIVPNSVFKKTGEAISESYIPIDWDGKHVPMELEYRDSEILTAEITRSNDKNGMDPLPLSDVTEIISIRGKDDNMQYHQWNGSFGDYKLNQNYVDWSPSLAGSNEPAAGSEYVVTYKRKEIDFVKIHLDTDYFEEVGTDIVWRSPEVKVYEGTCTPGEDFKMKLPSFDEFDEYNSHYKNIGYIVEDNDLWVETKAVEEDGEFYLIGSLNGKDPGKNWHPKIKTGFYYLKEEEFYMYSEPLKTVLKEKELPTVTGVKYVETSSGMGVMLLPKGSNEFRDSSFKNTKWKTAKVFNPQLDTTLGSWVLNKSKL